MLLALDLPLTPSPSKDFTLCPSCLCYFCWCGEEEIGNEKKQWGYS